MKSFKPSRSAIQKLTIARNENFVSESNNKNVIRSMLTLRSKTLNRFKQTHKVKKTLRVVTKKVPEVQVKPVSPRKAAHLKHLLRNLVTMKLRTGSEIPTMPSVYTQ